MKKIEEDFETSVKCFEEILSTMDKRKLLDNLSDLERWNLYSGLKDMAWG